MRAIETLQPNDCRFVLPGEGYLFCAKPRFSERSSYCFEHHVRCHRPANAKQRREDWKLKRIALVAALRNSREKEITVEV